MKRTVRRIVYMLIILLWLLIMSVPIFAFVLANQKQIEFGSTNANNVRVFLIQESEGEWIGIQRTKIMRNAPGCTSTTVRYLMWEGSAESATYCQCVDPLTGEAIPDPFSACKNQ